MKNWKTFLIKLFFVPIWLVILSIYMIVRTTKELKEIKELDYGKEE